MSMTSTSKSTLRVTDIVDDEIKQITLSTGEVVHSKTMIIATGAKWRELGVPGEKGKHRQRSRLLPSLRRSFL